MKLTDKEVETILKITKTYGGDYKLELRRELDELVIKSKKKLRSKLRALVTKSTKGVF